MLCEIVVPLALMSAAVMCADNPARALSETTDPSGAIITESPDPLVKGMDAGHAADPAYRAAYRQCMERRALR